MSICDELSDTAISQRQGLIVYVNSASKQYKLRRYGDVVYFSSRMGYCILYVNQKECDEVIAALADLDFVNRVEKTVSDSVNLDASHIEQQIVNLAHEAEEKLQTKEKKSLDQLS